MGVTGALHVLIALKHWSWKAITSPRTCADAIRPLESGQSVMFWERLPDWTDIIILAIKLCLLPWIPTGQWNYNDLNVVFWINTCPFTLNMKPKLSSYLLIVTQKLLKASLSLIHICKCFYLYYTYMYIYYEKDYL